MRRRVRGAEANLLDKDGPNYRWRQSANHRLSWVATLFRGGAGHTVYIESLAACGDKTDYDGVTVGVLFCADPVSFAALYMRFPSAALCRSAQSHSGAWRKSVADFVRCDGGRNSNGRI